MPEFGFYSQRSRQNSKVRKVCFSSLFSDSKEKVMRTFEFPRSSLGAVCPLVRRSGTQRRKQRSAKEHRCSEPEQTKWNCRNLDSFFIRCLPTHSPWTAGGQRSLRRKKYSPRNQTWLRQPQGTEIGIFPIPNSQLFFTRTRTFPYFLCRKKWNCRNLDSFFIRNPAVATSQNRPYFIGTLALALALALHSPDTKIEKPKMQVRIVTKDI